MSKVQWSDRQLELFKMYNTTNKNILVNAGPGSGKSFTMLEVARQTPVYKRTIFLAFNKSIADENAKKLPNHISSSTLHSLGFKCLFKLVPGARFMVNEIKTFIIIRKRLKLTDPTKFRNEKVKNKYLFSLCDLYNLYRVNLISYDKEKEEFLEEIEELAATYDFEIQINTLEDFYNLISIMREEDQKILNGQENIIDFTDMLWLLSYFPASEFPKYDVVFLDECFPYNQFVNTEKGKIKIGTLYSMYKKSLSLPKVKTYNEESEAFEYKELVSVSNKGKRNLLELNVGGKRKVRCTYNHPFLTTRGWVSAENLKPGEILLSSSKLQPYHSLLNEDQLDVFLVSCIGDGHLSEISQGVYRGNFSHGESQFEFLEWKAKLFGRQNNIDFILENGYSKTKLKTFETKGYCLDKRLDKEEVLRNLNWKQIALLIQDDGTFCEKDGNLSIWSLVDRKNWKLQSLLVNRLKELGVEKISIYSSFDKIKNKEYRFLNIGRVSSEYIYKNTSKYFHPNLSYKVPKKFQYLVNTYEWDYSEKPVGGIVLHSINYINKIEEVFDIEVKDNHNFIIPSSSWISGETREEGLIVHNCQDVNPLQKSLFDKIRKPTGRFVAVGDKRQLVYAFQGSNYQSFKDLENTPNTIQLPLDISYRCSKNVISASNLIFPDLPMNAFGSNVEGLVRTGTVEEVEKGDFVLCRNNKPLIEMFIELLKIGKSAVIYGKDYGETLSKLMEEVEGFSDSKVEEYFSNKLKETKDMLEAKKIPNPNAHPQYISLMEKVIILDILYKEFLSYKRVQTLIKELFKEDIDMSNSITLMTVHKSKGLEANRVFFLQPSLIPSQYAVSSNMLYSEKCLYYVAITRAKKELIYLKGPGIGVPEYTFKPFN